MSFRTTRAPRGAPRGPGPIRFLGIIAFFVLALPGSGTAQEGLAIGETAPPVVLETLEGDSVDLSEIGRDRPVLLEFWATWCTVCRALEPALRAAHDAYGDRVEFVIVAAAVGQTPDRVRAHLARHPLPGRVLWDTRGRFTRTYDAPGTGYIVILDADGAVAYTGTGGDQDLVRAIGRVLGEAVSPGSR